MKVRATRRRRGIKRPLFSSSRLKRKTILFHIRGSLSIPAETRARSRKLGARACAQSSRTECTVSYLLLSALSPPLGSPTLYDSRASLIRVTAWRYKRAETRGYVRYDVADRTDAFSLVVHAKSRHRRRRRRRTSLSQQPCVVQVNAGRSVG